MSTSHDTPACYSNLPMGRKVSEMVDNYWKKIKAAFN